MVPGGLIRLMAQLYLVKSLYSAEPPQGSEGVWWKYEIECELASNKNISGIREGPFDEVEGYLNKMLDAINKRTFGYQSQRLRHAHSAPRSIPAKANPANTREFP